MAKDMQKLNPASMSGKGNAYDNAVAESFFSNLKNELVHHCDLRTRRARARRSSTTSRCSITGSKCIRPWPIARRQRSKHDGVMLD